MSFIRLVDTIADQPAAVAAHAGAMLMGMASLTVVLVQADVMLPFAGMGCGFCLLFWLRREWRWHERAVYALASFFAALPFVWPAAELVEVFWPGTPPTARMAIGFLGVMLALPLVAALRAGTRRIEDEPEILGRWINKLLPRRWRFMKDDRDES